MPAKSTSPLNKNDGPAIQMEPKDHERTSSHGRNGAASKAYQVEIEALIKNEKWDEAMKREIKDVYRVAKKSGNPKKYNEAMREMLKYFKCLKANGLL